MPKAVSSPNIALIKYWGKANDELIIPRTSSLSITPPASPFASPLSPSPHAAPHIARLRTGAPPIRIPIIPPRLELPHMQEMKLQDLKTKSPTELLSFAEEVEVENASAMRKQELMFAILKQLASRDIDITGTGVVEVLQDVVDRARATCSAVLQEAIGNSAPRSVST